MKANQQWMCSVGMWSDIPSLKKKKPKKGFIENCIMGVQKCCTLNMKGCTQKFMQQSNQNRSLFQGQECARNTTHKKFSDWHPNKQHSDTSRLTKHSTAHKFQGHDLDLTTSSQSDCHDLRDCGRGRGGRGELWRRRDEPCDVLESSLLCLMHGSTSARSPSPHFHLFPESSCCCRLSFVLLKEVSDRFTAFVPFWL